MALALALACLLLSKQLLYRQATRHSGSRRGSAVGESSGKDGGVAAKRGRGVSKGSSSARGVEVAEGLASDQFVHCATLLLKILINKSLSPSPPHPSLCVCSTLWHTRLGRSCLSASVANQIAVISFNLSQQLRRRLRRRQQQMLPLAVQIVFVARLSTHTQIHTHADTRSRRRSRSLCKMRIKNSTASSPPCSPRVAATAPKRCQYVVAYTSRPHNTPPYSRLPHPPSTTSAATVRCAPNAQLLFV